MPQRGRTVEVGSLLAAEMTIITTENEGGSEEGGGSGDNDAWVYFGRQAGV